MKMREWERLLTFFSKDSGKQFYRLAELANISRTDTRFLVGELARLVKAGVIVHYTKGIYGLPGAGDISLLVKAIDPNAYVTAGYALYLHGLISQESKNIMCFTNRRHNVSRVRKTVLGTIEFICTSAPVYSMPKGTGYAAPAQALFDYVFVMRRRGAVPESVLTLRNLNSIKNSDLETESERYPETVRKHVMGLWVDV